LSLFLCVWSRSTKRCEIIQLTSSAVFLFYFYFSILL
jgi:hypothetical protein